MPELPEVITLRNDLNSSVIGKKIIDVLSFENFPLRPSKKHYDQYVVGHTILTAENIAKLILIRLSSEKYLSVHLRMTGNLLYNTSDKYVKTSFLLEDGSRLNFSEIRKFGYMEVWDEADVNNYKKRIGKTPIESDLTADDFVEIVKRRKSPIRNSLLDQRLLGGIGNIYANDALYLSKINPKIPGTKLSSAELKRLFKNLVFVLNEGVKHRGSSFNRYKDLFGKEGSHQKYFHVYGKKGQKCKICSSESIVHEKLQGRGIYYCPKCQTTVR